MANISVAFITKSPRSFFLPVATIVPVALYCGSLASYAHRAPQNDPPHESMQRGTQVGHPNLGSPSEKENHRFGHSTGRLQKSMESMSRGATTALPSEDANPPQSLGINRVAGTMPDRPTKPPISGAQLRAARALLKWSVRELTAQCRVSRPVWPSSWMISDFMCLTLPLLLHQSTSAGRRI